MNLKELLLEFAGENEKSLTLEDLLVGQVDGIKIEEDVCNGVRVIVLAEDNIDSIVSKIKKILELNSYSGYSVIQETGNNQMRLLIEVE